MEEIKIGERLNLNYDYYTSGRHYEGYLALWHEPSAAGVGGLVSWSFPSYAAQIKAEKAMRVRAAKGDVCPVVGLIVHPEHKHGPRYTRVGRQLKRVHAPVVRIRSHEYVILSSSPSSFTVLPPL